MPSCGDCGHPCTCPSPTPEESPWHRSAASIQPTSAALRKDLPWRLDALWCVNTQHRTWLCYARVQTLVSLNCTRWPTSEYWRRRGFCTAAYGMPEIELHPLKHFLQHGLGNVARSNFQSPYINWGSRNPRKLALFWSTHQNVVSSGVREGRTQGH
jgi:hypothetical protein